MTTTTTTSGWNGRSVGRGELHNNLFVFVLAHSAGGGAGGAEAGRAVSSKPIKGKGPADALSKCSTQVDSSLRRRIWAGLGLVPGGGGGDWSVCEHAEGRLRPTTHSAVPYVKGARKTKVPTTMTPSAPKTT